MSHDIAQLHKQALQKLSLESHSPPQCRVLLESSTPATSRHAQQLSHTWLAKAGGAQALAEQALLELAARPCAQPQPALTLQCDDQCCKHVWHVFTCWVIMLLRSAGAYAQFLHRGALTQHWKALHASSIKRTPGHRHQLGCDGCVECDAGCHPRSASSASS